MLCRVSLAAVVMSVILMAPIAHAEVLNKDACWQSDISYRVWTYREIYRELFKGGGPGGSISIGDAVSNEINVAPSYTASPENRLKFHRVPCPTPTGGFYVQGGIGGGWSVPSSPGIQNGSGSGATVDASFGWRFRSADATSWGFVGAGATYFSNEEKFPPPFDDLKTKLGVVFYQSAGLGPNFRGFAPEQNFAPYVEVGVAEANIKVSADVGSATHVSVAPLVGGGLDYRFDESSLLHFNVKTFFFGDKTYQLGAGGPSYTVNDRATSVTLGWIHQFK